MEFLISLIILRNGSEFRFSPYAFFGIGYSVFLMKGKPTRLIPPLNIHLSSGGYPFGGGVKYRLDDRWTYSCRTRALDPHFTDYLDLKIE